MAFRVVLPCYVCERQSPPRQSVRINGEDNVLKRQIAVARRTALGGEEIDIGENTFLCLTCNRTINEEMRLLELDPNCLRLNVLIQRFRDTCLVCDGNNNIRRLSLECRVDIYIKRGIYVPENVFSCDAHFDEDGNILRLLIVGLPFVHRPYVLNGAELLRFLNQLRAEAIHGKQRRFDEFFAKNELTEDEFKTISPVTKQQFEELFTFCDPIPEENWLTHISKKDLLLFLCKLRQGLSDEFLRVIFGYSSRQNVSKKIANVRQSLMQRFVPENVGFGAITRDNFIRLHVSTFENILYNPNPDIPQAIAYIDGTYCNIPRSSNFRALRQSYCLHKGRHLLKPALIVAPDGYILAIQGPYFSDARNNDAAMMRNEFDRDMHGMRQWFGEGDVFVVDRGYRDAVPLLQNLGIRCKMPPVLPPGQRQLATGEANSARLVTKTRWISESRNGHIQSIFKFFAHTVSITHAVNLGDFIRIAGAIINRYYPTLHIESNTPEFARELLRRAQQVNVVQARVEAERLHLRNARWIRFHIENNVRPEFPRLSEDFLRDLTAGTYQVRLAPSYVQDKILRDEQEEFQIDTLADEPGFIRVRLYSRFRNATKHQLWIAYNPQGNDEGAEHDREPISGYYCTCKSGARTLGTCAHVASVLWFLGFARYEPGIKYPSTALTHQILDAGNRPHQGNINHEDFVILD